MGFESAERGNYHSFAFSKSQSMAIEFLDPVASEGDNMFEIELHGIRCAKICLYQDISYCGS